MITTCKNEKSQGCPNRYATSPRFQICRAYLTPRVLSAIMLEDHHQGPYDLLLQTSDVTSVSFQDRPLPILKLHPSIHPSRDRKHHFNSYDYPSILSIKNTSDEKPLPAKQHRYRPLEARIILSKSTPQPLNHIRTMASPDLSLFPPTLLPTSAISSLPTPYTIRPLHRTDYNHGYLTCLSSLTWIGDISAAQFEQRFDWMRTKGKEWYYCIVIDDGEKIVGAATMILDRKLYVFHISPCFPFPSFVECSFSRTPPFPSPSVTKPLDSLTVYRTQLPSYPPS